MSDTIVPHGSERLREGETTMAFGKGKKKNVRGTQPRKRTESPAPRPRAKGPKPGPKKTAARTTTRSGDK